MNGSQKNKLDALILLAARSLAEENSKALRTFASDGATVPARLDRRIYRAVNKDRRRREYGWFYKGCMRAAAVFLVLCSLSFLGSMSIRAVRQELWHSVSQWYDKYVTVLFEPENKTETTDVILEKREPHLTLPGYEREVKIDTFACYLVEYTLPENRDSFVMYTQMTVSGYEASWDSEHVDTYLTYALDGHEAVYMESTEMKTKILIWNDGVYAYDLLTQETSVTKEELEAIARSVRKS